MTRHQLATAAAVFGVLLLVEPAAARLEGGRGGPNDVTDIAKDGDNLVLTFERSGRGGNAIDVVMTLTLDGEMINATQDVGGGRFSTSGSDKKQ